MHWSMALSRLLLAAALLTAAAAVAYVWLTVGPTRPEAWTTIAAALAVVTSVVSAFAAIRLAEIQQDAQRPYIEAYLDFDSRQGLVSFRIKNVGLTTAYSISAILDNKLENLKSQMVGFGLSNSRKPVSILLPQQSVSQLIDVTHRFMEDHAEAEFHGKVHFKDLRNRTYSNDFCFDASGYRNASLYETETAVTQKELQKIPQELRHICKALRSNQASK